METPTEPKESPVLETPAAEGVVEPVVDHRANAEALLDTLGKLKIDTPERLEGIANASTQTGRYANDLGTERQRVADLEARVAALQAAPVQQPQPQPQYEGYDYGQPAPTPQITPTQMESIVDSRMDAAIGRYANGQLQANQAVLNEYSGIQADPDYAMVQGVWDKHVANPRVQMAIQSRQTSLTQEFNRTKIAYYKGIAMNARDTMTGLLQQTPGVTAPPHVETGTTRMPGISQPESNTDRMRKIAENSQGTTEDLEAMLAEVLPSNDNFLQTPMEIKEGIVPRR